MQTGPEAGWYRGDCHVHSLHSSGGELTPKQVADAARAVGLDFIVGVEHNTVSSHELWRPLDGSGLLVALGQEVVTDEGHWVAVGLTPGQLIAWDYAAGGESLQRQLDVVHGVGGLCVAAHPFAPYPTGTFEYAYQGFDTIEVWNGPWTSDLPWQADNEAALAEWARALAADVPAGRWRPAIGNSDTHLEGQIGLPHTIVAASRFSADALFAGIRAGRSWIAESAVVHLSFHASASERTAGIGERLTADGEPATARVQVRGVPLGVVTFHNQNGTAHSFSLPATGSGDAQWPTSAAESAFVRIEVRHRGGRMAALTNPIILV